MPRQARMDSPGTGHIGHIILLKGGLGCFPCHQIGLTETGVVKFVYHF